MNEPRNIWESNLHDMRHFPRLLVVSDSVFISKRFCELLLEQNCQIDYYHNVVLKNVDFNLLGSNRNFKVIKKLVLVDYDYIVWINNGSIIGQTFSPIQLAQLFSNSKAKFLFATVNKENFRTHYFTLAAEIDPLDWRVVHYNYVWGQNSEPTRILQTLTSQIKNGKLIISGTGDENVYPLYIDDFIQGLSRALFAQDSKEKVYKLCGTKKWKMLDFAVQLKSSLGNNLIIEYTAKQADPWLMDSAILEKVKKCWWILGLSPKSDADSVSKQGLNVKSEPETKAEKTKTNFLENIISFKKKQTAPVAKPAVIKKPVHKLTIADFFKLRFFSKINFLKNLFRFSKQKLKPKKVILFLMSAILLFIVVLIPLIISGFMFWQGTRNLLKVYENVQSGKFGQLSALAYKAQADIVLSHKIFSWYSPIFPIFSLTEQATTAEDLFTVFTDASLVLVKVDDMVAQTKSLTEIMLGKKISDPVQDISKLQVELAEVSQKLGFIQLGIDRLADSQNPLVDKYAAKLKTSKSRLPQIRSQIGKIQNLFSILPSFLAFDGKKTYLVLFQNSSEIRATGGFIGSYALVTFNKGKLLDFMVDDIWNADGQLKGHVDPPVELGGLGIKDWFMRDANWSPDFPQSARQAEWFLEKETGYKVDGVIGIDLAVVQQLLEVIGPVDVSGYSDKITPDNFYERAQYQAEVNFFPGSTQKKSFLASLSTILFEKIKELSLPQMPVFVQKIDESLEKKDILVYFHDSYLSQKAQSSGWLGDVKQISFTKNDQFTGPGLADFLMVVDSNVGVNKANYFLTRSIDQDITLTEDGKVNTRLVIKYQNDSPSASWPGGNYKNYLRILLPIDVEKIQVRESTDGKNYKPIIEKIRQTSEFNKSIFGFLTIANVGETRYVSVTYERTQKIPLDSSKVDYILYLQKQPGAKDDLLNIKINYPQSFNPAKIMPQGIWKPQKISFSDSFDKDKLFAVELSH